MQFLEGKFRYHRLYITNDTLSLNENYIVSPTAYMNTSEELEHKKELNEKQLIKSKFDLDKENKKEKRNSNIEPLIDPRKSIKLKIPNDREIKKGNIDANLNTNEDIKDNQLFYNKNNINKHQTHFDSGGFNKLKDGIVNNLLKNKNLFY